jgi:hypothetical protein
MKRKRLERYASGREEIEQIAKQRERRGYQRVEGLQQ